MSQLTFDSFRLDFVDDKDNISILIPPDEDINIENELNLLRLVGEDFDEQEEIENEFPESRMSDSNRSNAITNSQAAVDPSNEDNNMTDESTVASHLSAQNSQNSQNMEIIIPDYNDISNMLDMEPDAFNHQIQSFINVYDQNEDILNDVYKELELTEHHLQHQHQNNDIPQSILSTIPTNTTVVDVSNQQLQSLDLSLFADLRTLNASHNELTSVALPDKITDLNLSHNSFKNSDFIQNLQFLTFLNLSHNECSMISHHNTLVHLDLNHNNISQFSVFPMPQLQFLFLNFNSFPSLPGLLQYPNLIELDMSNNKCTSVDVSASCSLQKLNLSNNLLPNFNGQYFPSLVDINLDNNNLEYITNCKSAVVSIKSQSTRKINILNALDCFQFHAKNNKLLNKSMISDALVELHLEHCHVNRISTFTVNRLTSLTLLNLNFNNIADVAPIAKMTKLEKLYLVGNRIKSFTMVLKLVHDGLLELDLRQNTLTASYYATTSNGHKLDKNEDDAYLNSVNDAVYVQRLCYRASIVHKSKLKMLDGLEITTKDVENSELVLTKLKTLNKYRI